LVRTEPMWCGIVGGMSILRSSYRDYHHLGVSIFLYFNKILRFEESTYKTTFDENCFRAVS
jgi:hypothetical protein